MKPTFNEFFEQVREVDVPEAASTSDLIENGEVNTSAKGDVVGISSEYILWALSMNEKGDAMLYALINRNIYCFDTSEGQWYRWNKHSWVSDVAGDALGAGVDSVVELFMEEARRQSWRRLQATKNGDAAAAKEAESNHENIVKRVKALQTLNRRKNVLTFARTGSDSLAVDRNQWDSDPCLIGCPNGVFDLRKVEFREGRPSDYIRTVTGAEFRGLSEPCLLWEKTQAEICDGNKELIAFKQRAFGYAISGETSEHVFFLREGPGGNGKGLEDQVLANAMGGYAAPIESEMLLSQKYGRGGGVASPEILNLRGVRNAYASEPETDRTLNASRIKWLTGSDSLTCRGLYQKNYVTFRPSHKLFLSSNYRPSVDADDGGFWRRCLLVPYPVIFTDNPTEQNHRLVDRDLSEKLKPESSGILSWLIRGFLEWRRQGLNPPGGVKMATQNYRDNEDKIAQFLEMECVFGDSMSAAAGAVYNRYVQWCKNMNIPPAEILSGTAFGLKMKTRFRSGKNYKGTYYTGLGLINREAECTPLRA